MAQKLNLDTEESTLVELTEAEAKRIKKAYSEAAKDIKKQMGSIPNVGSKALQDSYLKGLLNQIQSNLDDIDKELKDGLTSTIRSAAEANVSKTLDFLSAVGLPTGGAFSWVPDDVVRSIVSGKVYSGDWTLSGAIWANRQKTQSDIERIVAQGVIENKSVFDIAKDLEKYVDPNARKDWAWSKVYPGTAKKVDYNAQRLARTLTAHAYQQSFIRTNKNNPFVTEYEWRSSNSARVCEICQERDGQHYPKDGLPLDHPNGMCTYVAVIPDSMEDIATRLGDWANGGSDPELDKYAESVYGKDWDRQSEKPSKSVKDKSAKASKSIKPPKVKYDNVSRSEYDRWATEQNGLKIDRSWGKKGEVWRTPFGHHYMANYSEINRALNSGDYSVFRDNIEAIDSLVQQSRLPKNSTLYRFVDNDFMRSTFGFGSDSPSASQLVGTTFETKQYLSTTIGSHAAFGDRPVMLQIQMREGSHVYASPNRSEFELLIGRDKKWEIVDVVDTTKSYYQIPDSYESKKVVYKGLVLKIQEVDG